jgi:hypothetical protein
VRFLYQRQEEELSALVAEGVVLRDKLQSSVGDQTVDLYEALCKCPEAAADGPWLEWCIRNKLARVNGVRLSSNFLKELALDVPRRNLLKGEWIIPFAKNTFNQLLVATLPGVKPSKSVTDALGTNLVYCAATFEEWAELRVALTA